MPAVLTSAATRRPADGAASKRRAVERAGHGADALPLPAGRDRRRPTLRESIGIIEGVFAEHASGQFENPPSRASTRGRTPSSTPCPDSSGGGAWRDEWIGVFSDNARQGRPTASGLIVLNDVDTGYPLAVMDCSYITALRTAAASAVAARYLAPQGARRLGIVGAGVQGRYNLSASGGPPGPRGGPDLRPAPAGRRELRVVHVRADRP